MKRFAAPLAAVLLVIVVLAAVVLALVERGRASLAQCEAALERGDTALAIVFAKRAAQARLPGSPYPPQAYERLASIARERERAGDTDTARVAYRAIVSASRSTGDDGDAHVGEARSALAKLDGAEATPAFPSPARWTRVSLALGVILAGAGLAWLLRGGKPGWLVLAAGLVGIAAAALS